jgi:hypothetical protein
MKPKTKNNILKAITTAAVFNLIVAGCCLDSDNLTIPLIMFGASALWLFVFCLANDEPR